MVISIEKQIVFSYHSYQRMVQRAQLFGIDELDAKRRVLGTIKSCAKSSIKHRKRGSTVYCGYFHDNTTFYVVCCDYTAMTIIKTVIIEKGRE